jgi:hypothetical protein
MHRDAALFIYFTLAYPLLVNLHQLIKARPALAEQFHSFTFADPLIFPLLYNPKVPFLK